MKRTIYFSARQVRILKSLWIPGILIAIAGMLPRLLTGCKAVLLNSAGHSAINTSFVFMHLQWVIVFSWEPLKNKAYKKALLIVATFIILQLAYLHVANNNHPHVPPFFDTTLILLIWGCVQITVACFVTGKKQYWQTGLVAGTIIGYTTTATPIPPGFTHISGWHLTNLIAGFALPFLFYGWIYLVENFLHDRSYKDILDSKIQVLGGQEYRLLYPLLALSCWIIIFQSAPILHFHIIRSSVYYGDSNNLFEGPVTNTLSFIMKVSTFYITASMTRNIVISRMTTIASKNGWLYLFHYIPVVNIIPWVICSNTPAQHKTQGENAVFYITKPFSTINNYIIGSGMVISTAEVYNAYQQTRYHYTGANGFILLLVFAKLVNYFFLDKGKSTIITLVTLSCLAALVMFIAATGTGSPPTSLSMAIVLSYFFLIELFYPELGKTDAAHLPGKDTV